MKTPSSFFGYLKLSAAIAIPIVAMLLCRSDVRRGLSEWGERMRQVMPAMIHRDKSVPNVYKPFTSSERAALEDAGERHALNRHK